MAREVDEANPYDPPERQALEQRLQDDTHLQHSVHDMIPQEQNLAEEAHSAGYATQTTDARIQQLEVAEQALGHNVIVDQQDLRHWDHDHQGWENHLHDYSQAAANSGSQNPYLDELNDADDNADMDDY